jgi:hypothetical protein
MPSFWRIHVREHAVGSPVKSKSTSIRSKLSKADEGQDTREVRNLSVLARTMCLGLAHPFKHRTSHVAHNHF